MTRKYTDITINGNQETNAIKLTYAAIRVHEIVTQNDSLNGVHFHFTDSCKYKNFSCAWNMLNKAGAKYWATRDGIDIWFYHKPEW